MDAVLHDKPDDDELIRNRALFSPNIKHALDVHLSLVGKPTSPFKKFTDSVYLDPLGNWNSTFAVFTVVEGPQDDGDNKSRVGPPQDRIPVMVPDRKFLLPRNRKEIQMTWEQFPPMIRKMIMALKIPRE